MRKGATKEPDKERARYSHPGITLIREMVVLSYEFEECKWCKRTIKDKGQMEQHLLEHVRIQTSILRVQALRESYLSARDAKRIGESPAKQEKTDREAKAEESEKKSERGAENLFGRGSQEK